MREREREKRERERERERETLVYGALAAFQCFEREREEGRR